MLPGGARWQRVPGEGHLRYPAAADAGPAEPQPLGASFLLRAFATLADAGAASLCPPLPGFEPRQFAEPWVFSSPF